MKYVAPVAELVSVEIVSAVLASAEETTTTARPNCPNQLPTSEEE